MVNGDPVSWQSKRQSTVALSSVQAEYVALVEFTKEALWIKSLLSEMLVTVDGPLVAYEDNLPAISVAKHSSHHASMKHVDLRMHFLRELVEDGTLKIEWIDTTRQLADILTKPLGPQIYEKFRDQLVHPQYAALACYCYFN